MIESVFAQRGRRPTAGVAAAVVVLVCGMACTSVSHTDVSGTRAGTAGEGGNLDSATGGSVGETSGGSSGLSSGGSSGLSSGGSSGLSSGGSSGLSSGGSSGLSSGGSLGNGGGQAGAAGAGSSSDCAAGALAHPDLHAACIEDLGEGRLRFSYDFANAEQGLDWVPSSTATVTVRQRALVIVSTSSDIGVAIFKKKLHVDRASFKVSLLSGTTTNWYINTIWSGGWNPEAGYGSYHDYSGRGFIINGTEYDPAEVVPLAVGVMHDHVIEQSDSELKWTMAGTTITVPVVPLPVTDRIFAVGAWESSSAYYDIVFEGTLD